MTSSKQKVECESEIFVETFGKSTEEPLQYTLRHFPNYQNPCSIYQKVILPKLREGKKVLDIGCGRGNHTRRLPASMILGLDQSKDQLTFAQDHRRPTCHYIQGDLYQIPTQDSTFDTILVHSVVEHIEFPDRAFKEWSRALSPNGSLMIYTTNLKNPLYRLNRILPEGFKQTIWKITQPGQKITENRTPTYYQANHIKQLSRSLASFNFKLDQLVYGLDLPIPNSGKFYRGSWRLINRLAREQSLPVFAAIYRKQS